MQNKFKIRESGKQIIYQIYDHDIYRYTVYLTGFGALADFG